MLFHHLLLATFLSCVAAADEPQVLICGDSTVSDYDIAGYGKENGFQGLVTLVLRQRSDSNTSQLGFLSPTLRYVQSLEPRTQRREYTLIYQRWQLGQPTQ